MTLAEHVQRALIALLLQQPAARRRLLRRRLEAFVLAERKAGRTPDAAALRAALTVG